MSGTDSVTDSQAVHNVLRGRREDFTILVRRYMPLAYGVAVAGTGNAADADDVVQDALLKAFQALDTLRQPARFGPWLASIVRNRAHTVRENRRREVSLSEAGEVAVPAPDPMKEELRETLLRELDRLAPDAREVLVLHYFSGMTTREMAGALGISRHAAKKRLERARTALGTTLLDRLGETAEQPEAHRRREARVLAVVAAAKAPWEGTAAAASETGLLAALWGLPHLAKGIVALMLAVAGVMTFDALTPSGVPATGSMSNFSATSDTDTTAGNDVTAADAAKASGQVIDVDTQQPVPNVTLDLAPIINWSGPESGTVLPVKIKSDARGNFETAPLRAGEYALSVNDNVMVSVGDPLRFTIADGKAVTNLQVKAVVGGVIAGRVYDVRTGEGVPGVEIKSGYGSARSGPDGRYRLSALRKGNYEITRGFVDGYSEVSSTEKKSLKMAPKEEIELDFPLTQAVAVAGQVVDGAGRPVPGVDIEAMVWNAHRNLTTQSDENGTFRMNGFAPNVRINLRASKVGLVSVPAPQLTVSEGGLNDAVVRMQPEARVSGIVVDPSGRPVADVRVNFDVAAREPEGQHFGPSSAATDALGRFSLSGLVAGSYKFLITPPEGAGGKVGAYVAELDLEYGQEVKDLRFVYETKAGLSLAGRVADAAGGAVAGADITAIGPTVARTQTDPNGQYRLTGLWEGSYNITVDYQQNRLTESEYFDAGTENADIVVEVPQDTSYSHALLLRVTDAAVGNPVTSIDYYVDSFPRDGLQSQMLSAFFAMHDPKGEYRIDHRHAADYTVFVRATGYAPKLVRATILPQQKEDTVVEVALEPAAIVEGRVVGPDGAPVADALIVPGAEDNKRAAKREEALTSTGPDGSFSTPGLPAMPQTLCAYHERLGRGCVEFTPVPGQRTTVTIVLAGAGTIRGHVRAGGEALGQTSVVVNYTDPAMIHFDSGMSTDGKGVYEFATMPSGEALVIVQTGMRRLQRRVDITPGSTFEFDFDFAPGTASLAGTVTLDGRPCASGMVELVYDGGEPIEKAFCDIEAGKFRAEGLVLGDAQATIYVWPPEQEGVAYVERRPVRVSANGETRLDVDLDSKTAARE